MAIPTGSYFTLIVIIARPPKKTDRAVLVVLVTKANQLRSRVKRKCAPCHALRELPTELVGVQGKGLRGERLTWTRKGEGTRACL